MANLRITWSTEDPVWLGKKRITEFSLVIDPFNLSGCIAHLENCVRWLLKMHWPQILLIGEQQNIVLGPDQAYCLCLYSLWNYFEVLENIQKKNSWWYVTITWNSNLGSHEQLYWDKTTSFTYKPTLSAFILHGHGELCSGDSLACHALDVYELAAYRECLLISSLT